MQRAIFAPCRGYVCIGQRAPELLAIVAKPLVATTIRAYDEEIVRIKSSSHWKN
jgi:hypothetical protein